MSDQTLINRACTALKQRFNGFLSEALFTRYMKDVSPELVLTPGPMLFGVGWSKKGVQDSQFSDGVAVWISEHHRPDLAEWFQESLQLRDQLWFQIPALDPTTDANWITLDRLRIWRRGQGGAWLPIETSDLADIWETRVMTARQMFSYYDRNHEIQAAAKVMMDQLTSQELWETYWTRVVIDYILNPFYRTGGLMNIDFIAESNGRRMLYEVKQKYVSMNGQYGLDLWKAEIFRKIGKLCGVDYYYIVREVTRAGALKGWFYITFVSFFSQNQSLQEGKPGTKLTNSSTTAIMVKKTAFTQLKKRSA